MHHSYKFGWFSTHGAKRFLFLQFFTEFRWNCEKSGIIAWHFQKASRICQKFEKMYRGYTVVLPAAQVTPAALVSELGRFHFLGAQTIMSTRSSSRHIVTAVGIGQRIMIWDWQEIRPTAPLPPSPDSEGFDLVGRITICSSSPAWNNVIPSHWTCP